MVFMTPTIKTYLIYQLKYLLLYTIIDFNEVDIRIYQPENVIFTEAARPR